MASFGDLLGRVGIGEGAGGGLVSIGMALIIGAVGILVAVGFVYWIIKRKKNWNIKVEFRLPRDVREVEEKDGSTRVKGTITKEWGKGYYDAKRGVVFIKRPKKKAVPMKPFNIKDTLSGGSNILTVIQVGVEDYRPVLEDSYLELEDKDTGEEAALIRAKIDTSESKSWRNTFEREAKSTYTIGGWLREHGQLLGFGFIIICIFVGFAIVYGKIG